MLYEKIFKAFQKEKLKYVIVGGIAVNLHGYTRFTGDLDIVIALTDKEITKFTKIIKKLKMVPRMPVDLDDFASAQKREEWINEKNMQVFSVYNPDYPLEHIDVMLKQDFDYKKIYKNKIVMGEGKLKLPVIGLNDLIKMKKKAGRTKDLTDVKALMKLKSL